jgi:hypothetical protein
MSISVGNVTTAVANVYVSSGSTAITFMSLCNYSAGNVLANVYVVPSGSSSANANIVLASIELTALDTYQLYAGGEKLLLGTGDTVRVNANVNNAITTVVSYTSI